jgi:Fe-S cluster biogenesis protein NfuA
MTTHQMPTAEDVSASLDPLRVGLNADGYDLELTGIDEKVRLRVVALEGACEECLVPSEVMTRILATKLQSAQPAMQPEDIVITYPTDH